METVRVSGQSRPNSVAGAIAALLRLHNEVEVQAIGAMAVNQAVKAIAIARSYISVDQMDLVCVPAFVKLELESEERTAMKFICRSHKLEGAPEATTSVTQKTEATSEP
jgi:stage V sporulation protein S